MKVFLVLLWFGFSNGIGVLLVSSIVVFSMKCLCVFYSGCSVVLLVLD